MYRGYFGPQKFRRNACNRESFMEEFEKPFWNLTGMFSEQLLAITIRENFYIHVVKAKKRKGYQCKSYGNEIYRTIFVLRKGSNIWEEKSDNPVWYTFSTNIIGDF